MSDERIWQKQATSLKSTPIGELKDEEAKKQMLRRVKYKMKKEGYRVTNYEISFKQLYEMKHKIIIMNFDIEPIKKKVN